MSRFVERILRVPLCVIVLIVSLWLPIGAPIALASTCYGSTCTGLYPDGTGCAAQTSTGYYYNGSAKYEGRISIVKTDPSQVDRCDTGWTRVYNNGSVNAYVAGSTRYGCANYCYDQSTESGGNPPNSQKIAPGLNIYTRMVGPNSTIDLIPCGAVDSVNMISLPLGGSDPAHNSACNHVF